MTEAHQISAIIKTTAASEFLQKCINTISLAHFVSFSWQRSAIAVPAPHLIEAGRT
jgi:hypothetical protein